MSSENINKPISFESEEDDCSDDEETEKNIQHDTWTKAQTEWPRFLLIGKSELNVKFRQSIFHLLITPEMAELIIKETN